MWMNSPHAGRHSLLSSLGVNSAPPGLAGPPTLAGPQPPRDPDIAAEPFCSRPRPTHSPTSAPLSAAGDFGPDGLPGLLTRPGRSSWLKTQPPLSGTQTRPQLQPHSPQRRAPADRQSRRRARSSRCNAARRRTTTPRSPRAPRGTVGSAAAETRNSVPTLAGPGWRGAPSCGGVGVEAWGCL